MFRPDLCDNLVAERFSPLCYRDEEKTRKRQPARHRGDRVREQAEGGSTFCGRLPLRSLPRFRASQFQVSVLENSVSLAICTSLRDSDNPLKEC
jgi:hypothetical protein